VADGNRTTLIVAVAGIAATALVGLAGTGAAWLSARNDRAAQGAIARDERTYDRPVSAYLDAIDFIAGQERSFAILVVYKATRSQAEDPVILRLQSDLFLETPGEQEFIPIRLRPPSRLTSRLGAFGSTEAFNAFQEGQRRFRRIPFFVLSDGPGRQRLAVSQIRLDERFIERFKAFIAQVGRFRAVVHEEIG
jgi:hypothetical protein